MKNEMESLQSQSGHYDEYTIDLFAFGSREVEHEKKEFEDHITDCQRCRTFYNDLKAFYRKMDTIHPELGRQRALEKGKMQLPAPNYIDLYSPKSVAKYIKTLPVRIKDYLIEYKKPVFAGFAFACLLLCCILAPSVFLKDNNPVLIKYNEDSGILEVHNKDGKDLWQMPYKDNFSAIKNQGIDKLCKVIDIDNDGKNEIISILPAWNENEKCLDCVKIFNYKGETIKEKKLGRNIYYDKQLCLNNFNICSMIIDDFDNNGKKEILISMDNIHSPMAIMRLDENADIIGEYWHYGHCDNLYLLDLFNDKKKQIIITGCEDRNKEAVLIALNPAKITGKTEATQTYGYGLTPSSAELFYIKFPHLKEMDFIKTRPFAGELISRSLSDSTLGFDWRLFIKDNVNNYNTRFENRLLYYFTRDLKPVQIHSTDVSDKCYEELMKDGKITRLPDNKYFEELMKEIQYWDGKEWKKKWTRIGE
jgi:hypothetical protein